MSLKDHTNNTYNQHFVSQAEQRLNSCSADAQSPKAEIYSFDIIDRDQGKIRLNKKNKIQNNLAFSDLFTLARISETERLNFEHLFGRYEANYPSQVSTLRAWIATARDKVEYTSNGIDLKNIEGCDFSIFLEAIKNIYTYKLLNWLRNPYKISEVIKTFDKFTDLTINKKNAISLYTALTKKNQAEEKYICDTFSISTKEYKKWIRLLLLFLYSEKDEPSSLQGMVEEFFKADECSHLIFVLLSDQSCALLSDTGVIKDSPEFGDATYMNISKNCVILLQHTFNEIVLKNLISKNKYLSSYSIETRDEIAHSINAKLFVNDEELLAGYNKICVKAAALQVYSASIDIIGIKVLN